MLVLSRKAGESIHFPEIDVEIRVMGLRKSKVQLGIEAPRELKVSRGEQLDRLPIAQRQAEGRGCQERGSQDQDRMMRELVRLEATLMELAEMSDRNQRSDARQISQDAIERIAGIKRLMKCVQRADDSPKPISEFISVRSEVIDRLRTGLPEQIESAECVRQPSAPYTPMAANCIVA